MENFRIILAKIKLLIDNGRGANDSDLKELWNDLSRAISIKEQSDDRYASELDVNESDNS